MCKLNVRHATNTELQLQRAHTYTHASSHQLSTARGMRNTADVKKERVELGAFTIANEIVDSIVRRRLDRAMCICSHLCTMLCVMHLSLLSSRILPFSLPDRLGISLQFAAFFTQVRTTRDNARQHDERRGICEIGVVLSTRERNTHHRTQQTV